MDAADENDEYSSGNEILNFENVSEEHSNCSSNDIYVDTFEDSIMSEM